MRDIFETRDNFALFRHKNSILLYGKKDPNRQYKVTVMMPVYKNPDYFKIALESVLNQDYNEDYQILVVDNEPYDGNKNGNQLIVEGTEANNILYYRNEENIGINDNLDRCMELADAPFITFCHNDDVFLPNCLSRLMTIQKKTGRKLITTGCNFIDKDGNAIKTSTFINTDPCEYHTVDSLCIFAQNVTFGVGALMNKEVMLEIGGFDQEYFPSGDYACFTNYVFKYGAVNSPYPSHNRRMAVNTSYEVYQRFADVDKHFRECMAKHIQMPNILSTYLIDLLYESQKAGFEKMFAGKVVNTNISMFGRIILKIIYKYRFLRMYKF